MVGVAGNVKTSNLAEKNPVGEVFFPYRQIGVHSVHFVAQTDREAAWIISAVRQLVAQADPELAIFDVLPLAVEIYGVLAYSVTQRTREIEIRTALGASPQDVLAMIIVQGLRVSFIGLAGGAIVAFLLTRFMTAMLYDVKPANPGIFGVITLVPGVVAILASLIPSLRALRIHPSTALRYE